jgi:hypothetical protein
MSAIREAPTGIMPIKYGESLDGYPDMSVGTFRFWGPSRLDEVWKFAFSLIDDFPSVRSADVETTQTARPKDILQVPADRSLIQLTVQTNDAEYWRIGNCPDPFDAEGDRVSLATFVHRSLQQIAETSR